VSTGQIVFDVVVAYFRPVTDGNSFTSRPWSQVLLHSRSWLDSGFRSLNCQAVRWTRPDTMLWSCISLWTRSTYRRQQRLVNNIEKRHISISRASLFDFLLQWHDILICDELAQFRLDDLPNTVNESPSLSIDCVRVHCHWLPSRARS